MFQKSLCIYSTISRETRFESTGLDSDIDIRYRYMYYLWILASHCRTLGSVPGYVK